MRSSRPFGPDPDRALPGCGAMRAGSIGGLFTPGTRAALECLRASGAGVRVADSVPDSAPLSSDGVSVGALLFLVLLSATLRP